MDLNPEEKVQLKTMIMKVRGAAILAPCADPGPQLTTIIEVMKISDLDIFEATTLLNLLGKFISTRV